MDIIDDIAAQQQAKRAFIREKLATTPYYAYTGELNIADNHGRHVGVIDVRAHRVCPVSAGIGAAIDKLQKVKRLYAAILPKGYQVEWRTPARLVQVAGLSDAAVDEWKRHQRLEAFWRRREEGDND